jgi:hypothetical protein
MRICIDSCVFVHGIQGSDPEAVRYLLSDNRHFLRDLRTDAFHVLDATAFVSRWDRDAL